MTADAARKLTADALEREGVSHQRWVNIISAKIREAAGRGGSFVDDPFNDGWIPRPPERMVGPILDVFRGRGFAVKRHDDPIRATYSISWEEQ